jgi:uncharacterized protein with FMN-binding domain
VRRTAIVLVTTVLGMALVVGLHAYSQRHAALPSASPAALPRKMNGARRAKPAATHIAKAPRTRIVMGSDQPIGGGSTLGDLQVRIRATGAKITSVGFARLNLNGPESQQISSSVIPQLEQQTLAAQSANINGVSGATYTSQAYETSLQAALDKLRGG